MILYLYKNTGIQDLVFISNYIDLLQNTYFLQRISMISRLFERIIEIMYFISYFNPKKIKKTIPVSIYEYNQVPKQTYINSTPILFWFTRAKAEGYYTFNIISPYCSVFVFVAVKNIYSLQFRLYHGQTKNTIHPMRQKWIPKVEYYEQVCHMYDLYPNF